MNAPTDTCAECSCGVSVAICGECFEDARDEVDALRTQLQAVSALAEQRGAENVSLRAAVAHAVEDMHAAIEHDKCYSRSKVCISRLVMVLTNALMLAAALGQPAAASPTTTEEQQ